MALIYSVLAGKPEKFDGQDTENIKFSDSAKSLDGALKIIHDQKLYSFPICRIEIAGFEPERGLNKRWIRKIAAGFYFCLPLIYLLVLFAASNFHDYRLNQLYKHQAAQSIQRWINKEEAFTQSISRDQNRRADEGKTDAILWVVERNPKESWRLKPLIAQGNGDAIMLAAAIAARNNKQEADKLLHDAAAQGNEQALRLLYKDKAAAHE
ncbi:hypothetical protein CRQ34_22575 [Salmonella enterica subsp. enterica serovar Livingstone]|nr:hypothetical protein [Salmonella enterica subsp. enterica serovar Livingstone]